MELPPKVPEVVFVMAGVTELFKPNRIRKIFVYSLWVWDFDSYQPLQNENE